MSAVEKLEREVQQLPPEQFAEFASWFNRVQFSEGQREAWLKMSEQSLAEVWDNSADDVFNELLSK